MGFLQSVKQFSAVLGELNFGGKHFQHIDHDVHGGGEHGEEFVASSIANDFVVHVDQGVKLLGLE